MPESALGADAVAPARPFGSTALTPVPGGRDPKLAERIAAALEADVIRDGWPVGKALGSEDQLMQRYGVSRPVVREAIRLAEHRQVVRMRRGRGGGLVVVEPDVSAVTESMAIFLEYARADMLDLLEARAILERFSAAAAAAASPAAAAIENLHRAAQAAPDCGAPAADAGASRFHELVADATGNAALVLFIRVMAALSGSLMAAAGSGPGRPGRPLPGRHRAIASAIEAGNSELAGEVAHADMNRLRGLVTGLPELPVRHDGQAVAEDRPAKIRPADLIAARIRADIIARGWPVGESLGFEADLLQQYGIGRSQFREAIRILENHSVVRMQRGAAGGMVVDAPDGRAVVRAVSLYLTYQGVSTRSIGDLRAELEATTLQLAIDRLTPDGIERLNAVLDLERGWPDEDFRSVSHDLHAVIAELSGNRTLGLLQSIVMQLTAELLYTLKSHYQHPRTDRRASEGANAVRRVHAGIVQAMIARDAPRALRLLARHLNALARPTIEPPGSHH